MAVTHMLVERPPAGKKKSSGVCPTARSKCPSNPHVQAVDLHDRDALVVTAPGAWAIMDENVLRRPIGGTAVMRGQVARLLEASEAPNVNLQVLPFDKRAHPGLDGPFFLLGFPEPTDPDVVYVESQAGNAYLEQPHQISQLTMRFNLLVAAALDPGETASFLQQIAEET